MRELTFPRPADSSRHIAGLTTVTLEDGERVEFAHIGDTIYVRDADLVIWDRAYMTCIAEGHLSYMRSPEHYEGVHTMKVHRSPVASTTSGTIESATDLLTPALAQAFQIETATPRFLVDEDGAVRAVELLWPSIGLRTHSVAADAPDGHWEEVRAVPVQEKQSARHVEIVIATGAPRGAVILVSDGGVTHFDGRVVTDVYDCRRGEALRLRYRNGSVERFADVVDARVHVSSPDRLDLPRRLTRMVAAIDEGIAARYIFDITMLAGRHLRGDAESRVFEGRVETWLRDPDEVARRADTDVVAATEFAVRTVEDQRRSEEELSRVVFEGHDPFLGLSDEEREEMGLM